MKKIENNKQKKVIIYIIIFLFAFSIRFYGAKSLSILNNEAVEILSVIISPIIQNQTPSFMSQIIGKAVYFLFENNLFAYRFISILSGALLTLIPMFFEAGIGKRGALWMAFFIAVDPFLVANSLVYHGNSIAFLLGALSLLSFYKKNIVIGLIFFISVILSGRGSIYFYLTISALILVSLVFNKELVKEYSIIIKKEIDNRKIFQKYILPLGLLIIIFLIVVFRIDISTFVSIISNLFQDEHKRYNSGDYPIVYIFALFSYLPLVFGILMIGFNYLKQTYPKSIALNLLALINLLVILFYPNHLIIDLVWVSIPLWIYCSLLLEGFQSNFQTINPLFIILFLLGIIGILIGIVQIINSLDIGTEFSEDLISVVFILISIGIYLIFLGYTYSFNEIKTIIKVSTFYIVLFFQFVIFFRSAGINGKPEAEILWNGYFSDEKSTIQLLSNLQGQYQGTYGNMEISFSPGVDPVLLYTFLKDDISVIDIGDIEYEDKFIFTEMDFHNIAKKSYAKQKLVVKEYPSWTWDPIGNLSNTDFWKWLIWRNSKQHQDYQYLFVRGDVFTNSLSNGEINFE